MLKIKLLTIEDQNPEFVYKSIHQNLMDWLFVEKKLADLTGIEADPLPWVKSYAEWKACIDGLIGQYDLVFCTVDLSIPEDSENVDPSAEYGWAIVREIQGNYRGKVKCCVLTGLTNRELDEAAEEYHIDMSQVYFDFKDPGEGYPGAVKYIKSEILQQLTQIKFDGSDGEQRTVLLDESSGSIRDHYITRAPFLAEPGSWHVPILQIGDSGLGAQLFMEYVAYLAEAEFVRIDLSLPSAGENKKNYRHLCRIAKALNDDEALVDKKLIYVVGLDRYQGGQENDCIGILTEIMESLPEGGNSERSSAYGLTFRVNAGSTSRIQDPEARTFIHHLEKQIDSQAFPLKHLPNNKNGWIVGHPRILHVSPLVDMGPDFTGAFTDLLMEKFEGGLQKPVTYKGPGLRLDKEVRDLLLDKTVWSQHGNLAGLEETLALAFRNFRENRSQNQFEITRAHLDPVTRTRFQNIILNVDNASLSYSTFSKARILVIDNIDFKVEKGEILVILGPSGCGKSSILKLLSGLAMPTSGRVSYLNEEVKGPLQQIGMVFQDYSLFPWLTVYDNVAFGPKNRGVAPEDYGAVVKNLLVIAGLHEVKDSYPSQLSGGMRQRVAIIRALANDADVFLMDEPFGALDLVKRWEMQEFLLKTAAKNKNTVVFVTHDIEEAVFVGDRIYVASPRPLRLGKCFQVPFSTEARTIDLRHDKAFLDLVKQVMEELRSVTGND